MLKCVNLTCETKSWTSAFSFEVETGQWVGISGPNGSGKTTLLNLLAGFIKPESGSIKLDSQELTSLPPHSRQMNFMFQQNSLLPHLTCRKNLDLALHDAKLSKNEIDTAVAEACGVAAVAPSILSRLPSEISGGEIARVNLARALLRPCRWLLLDEPFAAFDSHHRFEILTRLDRWRRKTGTGVLFVSHDPADSLLMADRLLFIDSGVVVGNDTPQQLALFPTSVTMARLLKNGTIFEFKGRTAFVIPSHLYTRLDQMPVSNRQVESITISNWRATTFGGINHIIDIEQGHLWTTPADRTFAGTFFFEKDSLHFL